MHRVLRKGIGSMAIAVLFGAMTASAMAQQAATDRTSRTDMERIVIVMPDGSRSVRWVRKPTPANGQQRDGFRVSAPPGMLGGAGSQVQIRSPFVPRPAGERNSPQTGGVVGTPVAPAPPPGGDGGGGGGGGGGSHGGGGYASGEIIYPGSGFGGPTSQPGRVGGSGDYGYSAKAIARWDVIPNQIITPTFNIGVVAFHMAGIDRVDFIAEGGSPVSISEPSLNPRTGVVEYWGTIQETDFQDGRIEIRAIAYPLAGEPRVLEPLILYSNAHGGVETYEYFVNPNTGNDNGNGTRNDPFRSIARALIAFKMHVSPDGGEGGSAAGDITLLREGFYEMPVYNSSWGGVGPYSGSMNVRNDQWITIRPDAGLDRDDVVIGLGSRENCRPRVQNLRYQGVSIDISNIIQMYTEGSQNIWFDNTRLWDPNGQMARYGNMMNLVRDRQFGGHGYYTDCLYTDALYSTTNSSLVRNSHSERISGDVFQNSLFVVNSSVNDIDGNASTHHSDILQYFGDFENVIVYGVEASNIIETQNFFLDHYETTFNNCAFVNIAIDNIQNEIVQSQLNSRQNHMLFYHIANPGQLWTFRDDFGGNKKFVGTNVVFRNNIFGSMRRGNWTWSGIPSGVEIYNTHFVEGTAHGVNASSGPVGVDPITGGVISYSGSDVGDVIESGQTIPDLLVPDWAYGNGQSPNRGAFPSQSDQVAGN
jgi:hypothetical protein